MGDFKLPDQTLSAMNDALVANYHNERRGYIGASAIGGSCERRIWNAFHWVDEDTYSARSIKAITDGHHSEQVMAGRLRHTPGVSIWTEKPNGKQFDFKDGHLSGHLDGKIKGIAVDPKAMHVWEHKAVNEKKFNALVKFVVRDEDTALFEWDETYFAQAQIYMHYFQIEWHYLTCCTPGSRDETSVRTKYDASAAEHYRSRARRIVRAERPPARISESASWFACKWCPFTGNCHGDKLPLKNCRTCAHSTSAESGSWRCEKKNKELDEYDQREGCEQHLFNPGLVPGEQTDAGDDWIEYRLRSGTAIRNQNAEVTTIPTAGG